MYFNGSERIVKVKQMISNGMIYAHVVRKGNLNFHVMIRVLYSVILNFVKIVRKEKRVAKIIREIGYQENLRTQFHRR